jgi:hypothetical protein
MSQKPGQGRQQPAAGDEAASVLIFAAFTAWAYRHRRADTWILLGAAAIVARLWTYHRIYDDVLLLLPMVALYRLARAEAPPRRAAPVLFGLTWLAAMAPARLFLLARRGTRWSRARTWRCGWRPWPAWSATRVTTAPRRLP